MTTVHRNQQRASHQKFSLRTADAEPTRGNSRAHERSALVGKFCLIPVGKNDWWQGEILDVFGDFIRVQLYSWFMGEPSSQKVLPLKAILKWELFDNAGTWRRRTGRIAGLSDEQIDRAEEFRKVPFGSPSELSDCSNPSEIPEDIRPSVDAVMKEVRADLDRDVEIGRKRWSQVARRFRRETGDENDQSLYDLAIDRLAHEDVTITECGVRVELRPDLGDDRVEAQAYWPERESRREGRGGCLCRSMKSRGYCSHTLAGRILRFESLGL